LDQAKQICVRTATVIPLYVSPMRHQLSSLPSKSANQFLATTFKRIRGRITPSRN